MAMQNVVIEFNDDGSATITKGDGSKFKVTDPAKLAKFTEDLANKMGPIIERHAAHSHVHIEGGKVVSDEHVHE